MDFCKTCKGSIQSFLKRHKAHRCFYCLSESAEIYNFFKDLKTNEIQIAERSQNCLICHFPSNKGDRVLLAKDRMLCEECTGWILDNVGLNVEKMRQGFESSWLIRSSGRVLGPFSLVEVGKALEVKEVVPLDEVVAPMEQWNFLRSHPVFARILEEASNRSVQAREDTMTETSATVTDTETETDSEAVAIGYAGGGTFRAIESSRPPSENGTARNVKGSGAGSEGSSRIRSFGVALGEKAKARLKVYSAFLWGGAIVATLIGVVIVYLLFRFQSTPKEKLSYDELVQRAYYEKNVGEYSTALEYYYRAYQINSQKVDLNIDFAPMIIVYDNKAAKAKVIAEKIILHQHRPGYLRSAHAILGLASLFEGDFERAIESFLESLKVDAHYLPALANLGAAFYQVGKLGEAEKYLNQALAEGADDGAIVIQMAKVLLAQADSKKKREYHLRARDLLSSYSDSAFDYFQEVSLLKAYVFELLGDPQRAIVFSENLLDIDPRLTDNHRHDPLIYRASAQWANLLDECGFLYRAHQQSPRMKALYGYCQFRAQQTMEGIQLIKEGLSQTPEDPLMQAIYSYIADEIGKVSDAAGAIKLALNSKVYRLPFIVKAYQCGKIMEKECARIYWKKLKDSNSHSLEALAGLAEIDIRDSQLVRAEQYVREGLGRSANYIPLLRLEAILNNKSYRKGD